MPDRAALLNLLDNNRRWAERKLLLDKDYFKRLAQGQSPKQMWIACCDSRVPPSVICDMEPGSLFVHRNVANLVSADDEGLLAALQYAIEVLRVEHIIVCGHYGCGGIEAAFSGVATGSLQQWLRPVQQLATKLINDLTCPLNPGSEDLKLLVNLNIKNQVARLQDISVLQRAWAGGQRLAVHGLVYDISSGQLSDLGCGLNSATKSVL